MSLFICPTHGLHHGPFCCSEPQHYFTLAGTNAPSAPFADEAQGIDARQRQDREAGPDPKGESPVGKADAHNLNTGQE